MMIRSRLIGIGFLMLAAVASSSVAHAAVIVRSAKDLSQDNDVKKWAPQYEALTAALYAYDKCGADYTITDAQRDYLKNLFSQTNEAYVRAYHNEYVSRVGYIPDQKMMDEIGKILRKQQQRVVDQTALQIQQSGCRDKVISHIIAYPEQYRYMNQPGIQKPGEE